MTNLTLNCTQKYAFFTTTLVAFLSTQVLNACVAVLFVSTLTTCGVEGNQFAVEEEPLELPVDVSSLNQSFQICISGFWY